MCCVVKDSLLDGRGGFVVFKYEDWLDRII